MAVAIKARMTTIPVSDTHTVLRFQRSGDQRVYIWLSMTYLTVNPNLREKSSVVRAIASREGASRKCTPRPRPGTTNRLGNSDTFMTYLLLSVSLNDMCN